MSEIPGKDNRRRGRDDATIDQTVDLSEHAPIVSEHAPRSRAPTTADTTPSAAGLTPTIEPTELPPEVMATIEACWAQSCTENVRPQTTIKSEADRAESDLVAGEVKATLVIKQRTVGVPDITGQRTHDYELLQVLGEGGMGVVHNARQRSVDRQVAVKLLRPETAHDAAERQKFLVEAVVTADLDHPNVVPIYELGEIEDGTLFYSMKRVRGTAWSDTIRDNPLDDNLGILMRVADAAAFAHSRGVIHRDLKPENIMLGQFGEVLVLDWGLAQPTDGFEKKHIKLPHRHGGTPAYMAPEMALGSSEDIGPHSDIYLLGAMLYEIITGAPPHTGKTTMKCLVAAARNEIVPTDYTGELLAIALTAMATAPADRFSDVKAFQSAARTSQAHSESMTLAARAEAVLASAKQSDDYKDYVKAVFGFEEAIALWRDNRVAEIGRADARRAYAASALRRGDHDLAASMLDPHDENHAALLSQLEAARRERHARQQRLNRQRKALGITYATIGVVVAISVMVTMWLRASALQLANSQGPSASESMKALAGVQKTLSELRGWVVLGDQRFAKNRAAAWKNEIRPTVGQLQLLSRDWTADAERARLDELIGVLDDLYEAQWWIEDVAQTPGNEPARYLLLRDVEPMGEQISATIAELILREKAIGDPNERSRFVDIASDLRYTFERAQTALYLFVDSASDYRLNDFRDRTRNANKLLNAIATREASLPQEDRELVSWLNAELAAYERLAEEVIALRESGESNVALARLRQEAVPLGQKAADLLTQISFANQQIMAASGERINRISRLAAGLSIALAVSAFFVTWLFVTKGVRRSPSRKSATAAGALLVWLGCSALATAQELEKRTAGARPIAAGKIAPPDVYALVNTLQSELDLIRRELGKPPSSSLGIEIDDASPHEVYYQALTLFRKTDQLCFDMLRERVAPPEKPQGIPRPADVFEVVNRAIGRVGCVKDRLGIPESVEESAVDPSKTPTDVFRAILQANRQLNLLTQRAFAPSDVYMEVTLAIGYASRLLSQFPAATRLPDAPAFERRMRPADVYGRLLRCFERIRQIAQASGLKTLNLQIAEQGAGQIAPADVYDIASLLVSELAYLHSHLRDAVPPRQVFHPGLRTPSHVFQRVGILEAQLAQLSQLVDADSSWLQAGMANSAK